MKRKVAYEDKPIEELKRLILEEKKDENSEEVGSFIKSLEKKFVQEMKDLNISSQKKDSNK